MAGFLLIGLGASNIVPVLFRNAGSQKTMPSALAVGAITTSGYAGILVGPVAIGFVSKAVGTACRLLDGRGIAVPSAVDRATRRRSARWLRKERCRPFPGLPLKQSRSGCVW